MKLHIYNESQEPITNLAIADALLRLSEDLDLDPEVIAEAVLVQMNATSAKRKTMGKLVDRLKIRFFPKGSFGSTRMDEYAFDEIAKEFLAERSKE